MNKKQLALISREVFQVSVFAYFAMLLCEIFQEGFVSDYFDINIVLVIIFISGILKFCLKDNTQSTHSGITSHDYAFATILVLATAAIVMLKTKELSVASIILGGISGILTLLFSVSVLMTPKESE